MRHLLDETDQLFPVIGTHDHDWKILDFPILNERERLKKLVERAGATGHHNKRVGILNQQRLADEKIMQPDAEIEIGVGRLFEWQLDIASDRAAANLFCAAVCRFHNPWTSAGHHSETEPRNGGAHFSSQLVMWIVRPDAGRAKDRHAGSNEMQRAKSAQKIAHDSQQRQKLCEARARTFEENLVSAPRRRGQRRCPRARLGIGRSFTTH